MTKKPFLLAFFLILFLSSAFAAQVRVEGKFLDAGLAERIDSLGPESASAVPLKAVPGREASKAAAERPEKGNETVKVLVNAESREKLAALSEKIGKKGGKAGKMHRLGSVVEAEIPLAKVKQLLGEEEVQGIWLDKPVEMSLERSASEMHANVAWANGFTGMGIKVAVVDTGIDSRHEMLQGKVIAAENFTSSDTVLDRVGHGTHVAGIIAGNGTMKGIAYEAELLNAKVLDDSGSGTMSSVIAGINWAVEQGADVINLSLGGNYNDVNSPINIAIRDAVDSGVVVVVAAGNCGTSGPGGRCNGYSGVTTPGNSFEAITVGAMNDSEEYVDFSSGGFIEGVGIKPDLTAFGVGINSSTGVQGEMDLYGEKTGTSMATPFISGAAALLLQANPGAGAYEAKRFLGENAVDMWMPGKDILFGYGKIDLDVIRNANLGNESESSGNSRNSFRVENTFFTFEGEESLLRGQSGLMSLKQVGNSTVGNSELEPNALYDDFEDNDYSEKWEISRYGGTIVERDGALEEYSRTDCIGVEADAVGWMRATMKEAYSFNLEELPMQVSFWGFFHGGCGWQEDGGNYGIADYEISLIDDERSGYVKLFDRHWDVDCPGGGDHWEESGIVRIEKEGDSSIRWFLGTRDMGTKGLQGLDAESLRLDFYTYQLWHSEGGPCELGHTNIKGKLYQVDYRLPNPVHEHGTDTIVKFEVKDQFGNPVAKEFAGPKELTPDSRESFDFEWNPESTGNYALEMTVFENGVQQQVASMDGSTEASIRKELFVESPAILAIAEFEAPESIEKGSEGFFRARIENNGPEDTNADAAMLLLSEFGQVMASFPVVEIESTAGSSEWVSWYETIGLPAGSRSPTGNYVYSNTCEAGFK